MRAAWRTFGVLGLAWVLMLSLPLRAWSHTGAPWPAAPTPGPSASQSAMPCHEAAPGLPALTADEASPEAAQAPCPHGNGCAWCAGCAAGAAANAALPLALAGFGEAPAGHQPWVHAGDAVALNWAPAVPTPPPRRSA